MSDSRDQTYIDGEFETIKFSENRKPYYEGIQKIKEMGYTEEDYIHHFPCFTGHLTMARFFSMYESFKSTLGVAGHIADVGVYKGASLLYFAKLTKIFEPTTLTQVHGFDWFQGNKPEAAIEPDILVGSSTESFERVESLVKAQSLENIVRLHRLDLTKDLAAFFKKNSHLQFRLVLLDTGTYEVVRASLPFFWERLTRGGMMIFDQFNFEIAPGETKAVVDFFADKNVQIKTFPNGWMPTAFVEK